MFCVTVSVAKSHAFIHSASLCQPLNSYPVLIGFSGWVIVLPDTISIISGTTLPPSTLNVTVYTVGSGVLFSHFAYNVMFCITVSVAKSHAFIHSASLYQPLNSYPVLIGFSGWVIVLP